MSSTFLELCQTLRAEADISGEDTPTTVIDQVGDLGDCVRWIRQSWNDIQISSGGNWRWLHRDFTFQTVDTVGSYAYGDVDDRVLATAIDRFRKWDIFKPGPDAPRIYLTSGGVGGERELVYLPHDDFRRLFRFGQQNDNPPTYITVDDQDNLLLGPVPDGVYTVNGRYWRGSQVLVDDDDVPEMPGDYHDLVWTRALTKYAYKNVAPESLAHAADEDKRLYRMLMNNQLPSIGRGGPAA